MHVIEGKHMRNLMFGLIATLVLSGAALCAEEQTPDNANGWTRLSENEKAVIYYWPFQIPNSTSVKKIWLKLEFNDTVIIDQATKMLSMRNLFEFNCKTAQYRPILIESFRHYDLDNQISSEDTPDSKWRFI